MADQLAAESAEQPEQEGRGEDAPHTLGTLPPKIISLVLATMTVDADEPYLLDRDTLQPSTARKEKDASARRDLASLCLVSKRMASAAQQALYRNLLIRDAKTLVYLYRTFLEKPPLGRLVRRMSLDIFQKEGRYAWYGVPVASDIDMGPLLTSPHHGLGDHLTVERMCSVDEYREVVVEKLHTLQFRVLSRTSKLKSLDLNVHPILDDFMFTHPVFTKHVRRLLPLLWEEALTGLSSLTELQLIGKERCFDFTGRPNHYVAWICREFLSLPNLQELVWFNHNHSWFSEFPRVLSGPNEDLSSDAESIRTINLSESACLPHDLAALCSIFRNLESFSVNTDSDQCRQRLCRLKRRHIQLQAKGDTDPGSVGSGLVTLFLTDSLATLENLTTLNLDLHYPRDISRSLGPSGTLSLVGLPNLHTLAVPFQFFVITEPDGHHRVVSPTSVLPRALRTLRILACFWCLGHRIYRNPKFVECLCGAYRIQGRLSDKAPCTYQHPDAFLEFLEGISSLRAESFPDLTNIFYDESKIYPATHHHRTCKCLHHPTNVLMHCNRDNPDALRLTAVSETLRQSGVSFKMRATDFNCGTFLVSSFGNEIRRKKWRG